MNEAILNADAKIEPKGTRIHGIVPPLVTPLLERDALDQAGLERLVERVIRGGVHGIFILGTTGEAPDLSYRLRREVIERVCRQVGGRLPVLVGITDTSMVESLALARYAAEHSAAALVCAPPYYFPAGQPELEDFVRGLAAEAPLPLYLYNMPQMTKVQFEPGLIERVRELPVLAGIKDSSGDLNYHRSIIEVARGRPDWRVLIGPEHLLVDCLRMGGHGGVNGGAQVYPELFVGLYDAALRGDETEVASLQKRLVQFGEIYRIGKHTSAVIKGIKCALSLLGVCGDRMSEPFRAFNTPERERVRRVLDSLGISG